MQGRFQGLQMPHEVGMPRYDAMGERMVAPLEGLRQQRVIWTRIECAEGPCPKAGAWVGRNAIFER